MTIRRVFLALAMCIIEGSSHYYSSPYQNVYLAPSYSRPQYYNPYYTNHVTLVDEKPVKVVKNEPASCQLSNKVSSVPLQVIKEEDLNVVKVFSDNPYHETLVEIQTQDQGRVPAVRVLLPEPLLLQNTRTSIQFPTGFTILNQGSRTPVPIVTLLAPVSDVYYPNTYYRPAYHAKPYQVSVVYAVPIRYPTYPAYRPVYQQPTYSYYPYPNYVQPSRPLYTRPAAVTPTTARPINTTTAVVQQVKPQTKPDNLVTVLEFPNSVASPGVLYYQEVSEGDELGNRNPPQPVVPSGIVQSIAPQPQITVFVNSKESSFLQTLRDEAERNRQKVTNKEATIEAVY